MNRLAAVMALIAIGLFSYAIYSFAQVKPTVCARLDRLIDVDQERAAISRDAKLKEGYYVAHPAEGDRFVRRQNQAIADLERARC